MNIALKSLMIVVAAAIGLGLGFALRTKTASTKSVPTDSRRTPAIISSAQPATGPNLQPSVRANDDSPLATQLEHDLSMSSGVTRWLYWLEALERATASDFPRLYRLGRNNSALKRLLAERWVELDPNHLFQTLRARWNDPDVPWGDLARVLFREWPKRDPEAVITALNGSDEYRLRQDWGPVVAEMIMATDVERALRLMADWHIEDFSPRTTGVAKWAAADPRHAAEFTLKYSGGYPARETMTAIGKEWAKTDPSGALEFAENHPGMLGQLLADSVLKAWTARDLNDAVTWLSQADSRMRNRFSGAVIEGWAKQDAAAALTWCEANLAGTSLAQGVGRVISGVAEKDVSAAAGMIAAMSPSAARSEAASAIASRWFPAGLESDQRVKPEAIAWLGRLDADSLNRVMKEMQWGWATSDPQSMAEFLATVGPDKIPKGACEILARQLAAKKPLQALEWANRLPGALSLAAGGDAFAEWHSTQSDTAMQWLNALPPEDPRRDSYFRSAIRELAFNPFAGAQLATMTPAQQAIARSVIETMPLSEDRRATLLSALKSRPTSASTP